MAKKYPDPSYTLAYGNVSADLRNQKSSSYIPKPDWQQPKLEFVRNNQGGGSWSPVAKEQGYDIIQATSDYQVKQKAAYEKEQADLYDKEYNDWLAKGGGSRGGGMGTTFGTGPEVPLMPSQKARLGEQERQAYFANRPAFVAASPNTGPTSMREDDFKALYKDMLDPTQMWQLTSTGQYTNPQLVDAAVKKYATSKMPPRTTSQEELDDIAVDKKRELRRRSQEWANQKPTGPAASSAPTWFPPPEMTPDQIQARRELEQKPKEVTISGPTAMPRSGKDAWGKPETTGGEPTTGYGKDYLELPKGYKPEGPAGFYSNSPTWSGGTLNTNNTPPQQSPPPSTTNLSSTMPAPSPYRSAPMAPPPAYAAMQSYPPQRSQSESKFSEGFLNYLDQARTMKLLQGEAGLAKTSAETGLLGVQTGRLASMTPYEIAQIAAQTGLTGAQTSRINTLTPYEAAQMTAQTGLYGAQATLAGTQAMRTATLTPYEAAQMRAETGLTGAQTGRINTLTPYEAAQMAAQTNRINTLTPYEAAQMGAQTNRINTLTPYEAAQMAAQTSRINTLTPYEAAEIGSKMNLTNVQTERLAAITPYEIQQIIAGNQLTGAQAENFRAKTLSEYGMTPTGMANIFATRAGGQAALLNAGANVTQAGGSRTMVMNTPFGTQTTTTPHSYFSPVSSYFSPVSSYPYSSGPYTTTQILPPPPPRKDINVGLGGRTYLANFGSYGGYPVTGNYNQRSGSK
jgi:hypothetical protein